LPKEPPPILKPIRTRNTALSTTTAEEIGQAWGCRSSGAPILAAITRKARIEAAGKELKAKHNFNC